MLRLFGKNLPIVPVAPDSLRALPKATVWIDLLDPDEAERDWVEKAAGIELPTRDELLAIQPSARLYERQGVSMMTASVLWGVREGLPASDPVAFILTGKVLVTLRYVDPAPFVAFADRVYGDGDLMSDTHTTLLGLLDAIIDRLADELESSGKEIEKTSSSVFRHRHGNDRLSSERLEILIMRIGATQRLLTRVRETGLSTHRLLTFLENSRAMRGKSDCVARLHGLVADVNALTDHSTFLTDNLTFLLDAALGLIGIEQNVVMKIFSVVAVVLMPPTLIAGIYGMNFKLMPELELPYGYPLSLVFMVLSAVLPYRYARRRGWL